VRAGWKCGRYGVGMRAAEVAAREQRWVRVFLLDRGRWGAARRTLSAVADHLFTLRQQLGTLLLHAPHAGDGAARFLLPWRRPRTLRERSSASDSRPLALAAVHYPTSRGRKQTKNPRNAHGPPPDAGSPWRVRRLPVCGPPAAVPSRSVGQFPQRRGGRDPRLDRLRGRRTPAPRHGARSCTVVDGAAAHRAQTRTARRGAVAVQDPRRGGAHCTW